MSNSDNKELKSGQALFLMKNYKKELNLTTGRLRSIGSHKVTRLKRLSMHALEKEMATHSSILAWRVPGIEEPGGLLSMGSHRVRDG